MLARPSAESTAVWKDRPLSVSHLFHVCVMAITGNTTTQFARRLPGALLSVTSAPTLLGNCSAPAFLPPVVQPAPRHPAFCGDGGTSICVRDRWGWPSGWPGDTRSWFSVVGLFNCWSLSLPRAPSHSRLPCRVGARVPAPGERLLCRGCRSPGIPVASPPSPGHLQGEELPDRERSRLLPPSRFQPHPSLASHGSQTSPLLHV